MLRVQSISYARGSVAILERIGFELDRGEVLMVRGGNGSGKTTLLRLLAGLLPAQDDFSVSLDQAAFDPCDPRCQARFLYLGHALGIKDELTTLENLEFCGRFLGCRPGMGPPEALCAAGLDGYQYTLARRLSAGQRKRLGLARVILCPAELWLLDEPYSNLDADGLALVDKMLQRHIDEHGAALITSHGTFVPQVSRQREIGLHGRVS